MGGGRREKEIDDEMRGGKFGEDFHFYQSDDGRTEGGRDGQGRKSTGFCTF